jgi:hypothetical protein
VPHKTLSRSAKRGGELQELVVAGAVFRPWYSNALRSGSKHSSPSRKPW